VVEGLSGVVREVERKRLLDGLKIGRDKVGVSMLQFPDDTIFMCKAINKNVMIIKGSLRCFEMTSGLKVNLHKSKLEGIGVQPLTLQRFATILNCKIMKLSFSYLEVPIGGNQARKEFWKDMVAKIKKKLSRWKEKICGNGR